MYYLTEKDIPSLKRVLCNFLDEKTEKYFDWISDPNADQKVEEIIDIFTSKLNSTYSERFVLVVCLLINYIQKGHQVAFLQKSVEIRPVFDASQWAIISVNKYPLFHINPEDLSLKDLHDLGWLNVIQEGSKESLEHAWKETNKPQEFKMLLEWSANDCYKSRESHKCTKVKKNMALKETIQDAIQEARAKGRSHLRFFFQRNHIDHHCGHVEDILCHLHQQGYFTFKGTYCDRNHTSPGKDFIEIAWSPNIGQYYQYFKWKWFQTPMMIY